MLIQELLQQLQAIMDSAVERQYVAGVSLLVCRNGAELLRLESGYADTARKIPFHCDTLLRLYSMTKPITSAAVMMLLEQGKIDLADPISDYLEGFREQKVAAGGSLVPPARPMMIRDLLSMTSGLMYGGTSIAGHAAEAVFDQIKTRMYGADPITTVEAANLFGSQPLDFEPGAHFCYGTSADVLGAVVETVSGQRFGEFLQEHLFAPLDMEDTGFYAEPGKLPRLSLTYENRPDGSLAECPTDHLGILYRPDAPPAFESGGAGLISTLPDYSHFGMMLLNGGIYRGRQVLLPETIAFMTRGELMPWQQKDLDTGWDTLNGYSYANLMRILKEPSKAILLTTPGEYGWDGWLGPFFSNHPDRGLTFLVGMQRADTGTCPLTRKLRNRLLSSGLV